MPATLPPAGPEMDDNESEQYDGQEWKRRRAIWVGCALVTVFVGGLLVWLSEGNDTAPQAEGNVPLVKAAEMPVKVRPEDPGGMHVAHRDKLIYQRFEGDEATPVVERLLSAPEEPLPLPRSEPETSSPGTLGMNDDAPPTEFTAVPPEETTLAQPTEEFLEDMAPRAPSVVETQPESFSVAVAAPRPRPTAPPPPPSASGPRPNLSAEARAAQALLTGAEAGGYALQLGSVRSRQEANLEWERLRSNHADILGGLRPTVLKADLGQRGMYYRLQAGPITSQKSAHQLCNSLVGRKVACIVVQH